ncbi:MAG TPA: hypothetical protein VGE97_00535 [Nitrososphaera sp.]
MTSIVGFTTSIFGIYRSLQTFIKAADTFDALRQGYDLSIAYPAFLAMTMISLMSCILLIWCSIDLMRLRFTYFKVFVGVCLFILFYYIFIGGFLWLLPKVGLSIAVATGIGNSGLSLIFYSFLPLWGPVLIAWSRMILSNEQDLAKQQNLSSNRVIVARVFLYALIGGLGGGLSSILLLPQAIVPGYISHNATFLLAGIFVITSEVLCFGDRFRMPVYFQVVVVAVAAYFTSWLRAGYASFFSLFPMAIVCGLIVDSDFSRSIKRGLGAFFGAIFGMGLIAITLWTLSLAGIVTFEDAKYLTNRVFPMIVGQTVIWYGFTLGLLLSR